MKIAIIGLGAVGTAIACALHAAGHSVCAIVRPQNNIPARQNIYNKNISLQYKNGKYSCSIRTQYTIDHKSDLIITCLRAYDTYSVLQHHKSSIQRSCEQIPTIILQNGVTAIQDAYAALGNLQNIFCAVSSFASRKQSQDQNKDNITVRAGDFASILMPDATTSIEIGCANPKDKDTLMQIKNLLKNAINFSITPNTQGMLWNKLVVNHINALPAILNKSIQDCIRNDVIWWIIQSSMQEAARLAAQRGVQITVGKILSRADITQLTHASVCGCYLMQYLTKMSYTSNTKELQGICAKYGCAEYSTTDAVRFKLLHAFGVTPNYTSLHSSILRRERTEIDYLNGYTAASLAKVARGLQDKTQGYTINSTLASCVLQTARTGKFLTLSQLMRHIVQDLQIQKRITYS